MGWRQWKQHAVACRTGVASVAIGLALAVAGLGTSMPASAQIAGTKHNLGSTGTGTNKFSGTAEICVFCHTPHGADTSAAVPLWNRTLPAPSSFTTYDSLGTTSLDGKTAPVGSVSIACLSCHDGVTSMSAVINAPGSGTGGDSAWTGGTWNTAVGATGKMPAGITNLTQDLKNDHPIGIQYGGGGITKTSPTAATKDTDFRAPANADLNGNKVWWVDTEKNGTGAWAGNGTRQKTDMLLYTRAPSTTAAPNSGYTGQTDSEPFVECASCHDPHTTNTTFLRILNTGSQVCLACHVK